MSFIGSIWEDMKSEGRYRKELLDYHKNKAEYKSMQKNINKMINKPEEYEYHGKQKAENATTFISKVVNKTGETYSTEINGHDVELEDGNKPKIRSKPKKPKFNVVDKPAKFAAKVTKNLTKTGARNLIGLVKSGIPTPGQELAKIQHNNISMGR